VTRRVAHVDFPQNPKCGLHTQLHARPIRTHRT
jgi:hypothetical protein